MIYRCEKNRLIFEGDEIPKDGVYVFTRKTANSYALFTEKQFGDFSEMLKKAESSDDKTAKYLMRYILGSAVEVEIKNGAFHLPAYCEDEMLKADIKEKYIELTGK